MNKKLALFIAACAMAGLSACNESVPWTETDCDNGVQRCDRNAVEICVDGKWEVKTVCTDSETCNAETYVCDMNVVCQNDEKRCADGAKAIEICNAGVWEIKSQCAANETCNAETFVCDAKAPDCEDGAKRCEANNVQVCAEGAWKIDTTCTSSEVCNPVDYSCDATCEDGSTKCTEDGKLSSCADNKWSITDCDADEVCLVGKTACEEKICEEGEVICNDDNDAILTCTNNVLVETACKGDTLICDAGACVVCINDDKRCENNAVEVCEANVWKEETACGAKTCNEETYTCEAKACTAGWKRCSGNVVEACNAAGEYVAVSPAECADGLICSGDTATHTAVCVECKTNANCAGNPKGEVCNVANNTCVACAAGDTKCHDTDGTISTCSAAGAWEASVACDAGKTCVAGAKECTAIDGYCASEADCKDPLYPACYENKCECGFGQGTCKIEGGVAKYNQCFFGEYSEFNDCDVETPVCNPAKTECAECAADTDCKDGNKCETATGKCKADPVCTDYDSKCDGKTSLVCTVDKWVGTTCENFCHDDNGCVACLEDSHCTVAGLNVCGKWGNCVACKTGATKCTADGKLSTCSAAGSWPAGVDCAAGFECLDENTECTAVEGYCSSDTDCTDPAKPVCNTTTNKCEAAPECSGTETKCEGNMLHTCVENVWGAGVACAANEECLDGNTACTAIEGYCSSDTDCTDPATPVCNTTTNTCEAAPECVVGTDLDKCMGSTWMTCDAGVWVSIDCATEVDGPLCLADKMCVQCTENSHCTGTETCENNVCVLPVICEAGTTRCTGEVFETCNDAGTAYDSIECGTEGYESTPFCHLTEMCVECTETSHCTGTEICQNNECVLPVICEAGTTRCTGEVFETCNAAGTAYDSIECGTEGYESTPFCHLTEMCVQCTENSHCTDDAKPVCNTTTFVCEAASGDVWNFTQDFESFTKNTSYTNTQTIVAGDVTTKTIASIGDPGTNSGAGSITGNSVVFGDKTAGSVTISQAASAHLGTISFEYRSWKTATSTDSFNNDQKIEIYLDDAVVPVDEVLLEGEIATVMTKTIAVGQNVKSVRIEKSPIMNNNNPRIVIDNVKLTN